MNTRSEVECGSDQRICWESTSYALKFAINYGIHQPVFNLIIIKKVVAILLPVVESIGQLFCHNQGYKLRNRRK